MQSESEERLPMRRRKFFLLGVLCELSLVVLSYGLPACWLAAAVRNFALVTHQPLVFLLKIFGGPEAAVLVLPIGLAAMSAIWGYLIYHGARGMNWFAARLEPSQRTAIRYTAVSAALALLAWAVVSVLPARPRPFASTPEINAVVDANNTFALELYRQLAARPGNVFLSPYSISAALAMTSAGARGQTASEMNNALHFSLPSEKLHATFKTLNARLAQVERWNRIALKCANSLWGQKEYPFCTDFTRLVRENYRTEVRSVDFVRAGGAATDELNRWIERATNHRIKGGFGPGQLAPDTKLALCNAIYFKGKWLHQFKPGETKPAPFHITTNETVEVPMMYQKAEFKSARSEDGSVMMLELPYVGRDLSLVVLLPTDTRYLPDAELNDLRGLERKLTPETLHTWLAELDKDTPRKTSVRLPRFTTASNFDLVPELKALGMTTAFGGDADFSGMDGTKNLYLSDVLHQSFVEVNEAGTEAAAVTIAVVSTKGKDDFFIVDRPFFFLIRDNGSGSILFLGRVVDPSRN